MKKNKKKFDLKNIIANIVIVILSIILFISLCVLVVATKVNNYNYVSEVRTLTGDISRENYLYLVESWRNNLKNGVTAETNPEYAVVYAVAEYYSLLPEYKVYLKEGYEDKRAEYEEKMKKDRENMGDLVILADEFDNLYGLK